MHHEYMVQIIQPLAVRRYLGLDRRDEARGVLRATHGAAIHYSEAAHWGDSSNKLSWLIPDLAALLPDAQFVHLVRDGRKVASSYFHKLGDECYDDRSTAILQAHLRRSARIPRRRRKRNIGGRCPRKATRSPRFRGFDQFERIAWHWAEINRVILEVARSAARRTQACSCGWKICSEIADAVRGAFRLS